VACTSIAPTGTLSLIAGTSAGIEPLFALAYRRHVLDGQTLVEVNPLFLRYAREQGFYSERLVQELARHGSLAAVGDVPAEARRFFRTALEIAPEAHLRIQAAFQRHVDNAVSKTINLPQSATPQTIANIYYRAWELGCKGITIFRYGSKNEQVLSLGVNESPQEREYFSRCDPDTCKL
jgi:ribonucleoside-diphosphate reductase alpha chain